jgi:hypothetical protein
MTAIWQVDNYPANAASDAGEQRAPGRLPSYINAYLGIVADSMVCRLDNLASCAKVAAAQRGQKS